MVDRDKQIVDAVTRFRCLSRPQIERLFFGKCKRPTSNANNVLKRLRDRRYLTAAPWRQPYVYLPAEGSAIRHDSNKIDHYLAIADVYAALRQAGKLRRFDVEPRYQADVRPDIFALYRGAPFWIEVQQSRYTSRQFAAKLARYDAMYESGEWREFPWQAQAKPVFPYVLVFGDGAAGAQRAEGNVVKPHYFQDVAEFLRVNR